MSLAIISGRENPCLETLPIEVLYLIIDLLLPWDIKTLSCISKRLRQVCLPSLFHRIEFCKFSHDGFEELKNLLKLDARHHVVSFTYTVPELLNTGVYPIIKPRLR